MYKFAENIDKVKAKYDNYICDYDKSVNVAVGTAISKEEYEKKVKELHDLYIACSKKLPDYRFYLPIMKDDDWRIRRYYSGVFREISYEEFRKSLKEQEL